MSPPTKPDDVMTLKCFTQYQAFVRVITEGFTSKKASNAKFWLFSCNPEQTIEQRVTFPVIWGIMTLISHTFNDL